jgi:hypothetical protein
MFVFRTGGMKCLLEYLTGDVLARIGIALLNKFMGMAGPAYTHSVHMSVVSLL